MRSVNGDTDQGETKSDAGTVFIPASPFNFCTKTPMKFACMTIIDIWRMIQRDNSSCQTDYVQHSNYTSINSM